MKSKKAFEHLNNTAAHRNSQIGKDVKQVVSPSNIIKAIEIAEDGTTFRAIRAFEEMVRKFQDCEMDVCDHSRPLREAFVELLEMEE